MLTKVTIFFCPKKFVFVHSPFLPVRSIFQINDDAIINVNLVDNLQTPITENIFGEIIENYSKSGSFYINFNYDAQTSDSIPIRGTVK